MKLFIVLKILFMFALSNSNNFYVSANPQAKQRNISGTWVQVPSSYECTAFILFDSDRGFLFNQKSFIMSNRNKNEQNALVIPSELQELINEFFNTHESADSFYEYLLDLFQYCLIGQESIDVLAPNAANTLWKIRELKEFLKKIEKFKQEEN